MLTKRVIFLNKKGGFWAILWCNFKFIIKK